MTARRFLSLPYKLHWLCFHLGVKKNLCKFVPKKQKIKHIRCVSISAAKSAPKLATETPTGHQDAKTSAQARTGSSKRSSGGWNGEAAAEVTNKTSSRPGNVQPGKLVRPRKEVFSRESSIDRRIFLVSSSDVHTYPLLSLLLLLLLPARLLWESQRETPSL